MTNFFKAHNLYKLIIFIFLAFTIIKFKSQFITLKSYNSEIATLNQKIAALQDQANKMDVNCIHSRKDNEDIARKDLKMYYPNETPYKGY